jgi:hypothetical protein
MFALLAAPQHCKRIVINEVQVVGVDNLRATVRTEATWAGEYTTAVVHFIGDDGGVPYSLAIDRIEREKQQEHVLDFPSRYPYLTGGPWSLHAWFKVYTYDKDKDVIHVDTCAEVIEVLL